MAIIGTFTKTDAGFTGTLHTLAVLADAAFAKNSDKQSSNHPDYHLIASGLKIGAAWDRTGKRGRFLSVSFDDPSFAPGFYSLQKSGSGDSFTLIFERQKSAKAA